jgi:hypothetical protein
MSISTYFRLNIHQNGPEILGVNQYCAMNKHFIDYGPQKSMNNMLATDTLAIPIFEKFSKLCMIS